MKKTIVILQSKNGWFYHNLEVFFVAICGTHAKRLCQIYSSNLGHGKIAVAKEICELFNC